MNSAFPHPVYSQHVLQPAYREAQQDLFTHMLAAHEAHAVMLAECNIITRENARAICAAVAEIQAAGPGAFAYQPGVEDLFFRIESAIMERVGPEWGGNLQLARSRNDLGHALFRMALRQALLQAEEKLLALRQAVHAQALEHAETLMPGYTHTQPAQPTTFGHYLAGVLAFLAKDQARFAAAYANMNESPLGAAAFTGTGFPIDRERVAALLGFDRVIASTQHAIGAGDHLTDAAFAVQSLAVGLTRVTKDLLFLATQESGALRIHDSFIQISSIMPQKRNPVVLEHLRARLSRAMGYAQTVILQCHSIPYGDTQDIEDEIMPPLLLALETLGACLDLYTAVFQSLSLNKPHLARRAGEGFTTATELADALVREAGLPFRVAHSIVSRAVNASLAEATAAETGRPHLTLEAVQTAAQAVLGRPLHLSQAQFQRAVDPAHFVAARQGLGGAAPEATRALLAQQAAEIRTDQEDLAGRHNRLAAAEDTRRAAIAALHME